MLRSLLWPGVLGATDEQLMWRVGAQDDHEAFARLVERWERPMQNLCVRMTGDSHRSQDLTQELFLRLFSRRKEYQPSGKFSTYIWRVALNLCYDELRRRKRRAEFVAVTEPTDEGGELDHHLPVETTPHDLTIEQENADFVREALMQLTDEYRTVVVLRHYQDLKFREIAAVLEIPEGTVKSRMAEAMNQLNRLLQPLMNTNSKQSPQALRNPHHAERLAI